MKKKKLNTDAIANELQSSVFFRQPPSSPSPTPQSPAPAEEGHLGTVQTVRSTRTVEPNDRTVESAPSSSLLEEISQGVKTDRRSTERYSFEIYCDQIPQIEELQYLYKKRTGQKLPASRILREALEAYLDNAFSALKRKK